MGGEDGAAHSTQCTLSPLSAQASIVSHWFPELSTPWGLARPAFATLIGALCVAQYSRK